MGDMGERELLAIIFTDAVGSTTQTAQDEDKSLSMLMADLDFIRNEAGVRGGSVLKNTGDGLLISFKSAVDAVECALAIQKSFQSRPKGSGFQHKIGVHIGDVIKKDGDIYGAGVNTASRLTDQCRPGGICLSSTLFELTKQKSEIGQLKLKDFLLQNTEPPILAYQSFEGDFGRKEKTVKKDGEKPITYKKSQLIYAGLSALLIAGVFAFVLKKRDLPTNPINNGKLYGFEYKSGAADGLKSTPNGAPILWTLENKTDVSLELRWYDLAGRPKVSDNLNTELSRLGPGGEFHGKTCQGHAFGLFDAEKQTMLGSVRFLSGDRLSLVAEKYGEKIVLEPKYLRLANEGDALAQAQLSESYWESGRLPRNNNEALRWAKMSLEQGHADGMCMMAALLDSGSGIKQNANHALELWQKAAALGHPWAFARLGDRYLNGYGGLEKNYEEAVRWLTQAADRGNHWAMLNLGKCYENGWGVNKSAENPDSKDAKDRLEELQRRVSDLQKGPVGP
ncbi:hypothetical protein EBT23_06180 [bacterium]|nr:hypothetical protein [bacterium]